MSHHSLPRFVVAAGLVLMSLQTAGMPRSNAAATNEPTAPCCRRVLESRPPSDQSIYQLEARWTSDFSRRVPLAQFRGRPQVIAMFYSHCDFACPLLVARLKSVEAALVAHPPAVGTVEFLLVSIDPERDTPFALHAYRGRQGLSPKRWTLLTGDAGSVRELSALLGVQYRKEAQGQFAHSNILTLLNAEGEVVHQSAGLRPEVTDLVEAIGRLTPPKAIRAEQP